MAKRTMEGVPSEVYDRARMALYKLSTIPGATEAIDRVNELCQKEIAALAGDYNVTLKAGARGSTALTAAEREVAERCGVPEADLILQKARQDGAKRVLASASETERVLLKVMVGEDEIAQARRLEELRAVQRTVGATPRAGDAQPLPGDRR